MKGHYYHHPQVFFAVDIDGREFGFHVSKIEDIKEWLEIPVRWGRIKASEIERLEAKYLEYQSAIANGWYSPRNGYNPDAREMGVRP